MTLWSCAYVQKTGIIIREGYTSKKASSIDYITFLHLLNEKLKTEQQLIDGSTRQIFYKFDFRGEKLTIF